MPVMISMLRGVNIGGHHKIKMEELRVLYQRLKLRDVESHVQSGNVIFRTAESDIARVGRRIENAIEKKYGFRPSVILRTPAEFRDVIARNPFVKRKEMEPSKLAAIFWKVTRGRRFAKR